MLPIATNFSPLKFSVSTLADAQAQQHLLVVVAATFNCVPGADAVLADEQVPIFETDEYHGELGKSSLRYDCDLASHKPRLDLTVVGAACAPRGQQVRRVVAGIRIGSSFEKMVSVTGDRFFRMGMVASSPKPFERMELVYERAYGGSIDGEMYRHNPVGIGFKGATALDPAFDTEFPNIESLRPNGVAGDEGAQTTGLGAIARNWKPRETYKGTYDDKWLAEQFPLLPYDFDVRFFQSAPQDQQLLEVRGGEPVEVVNMTPDGNWRFRLPTLTLPVWARYTDAIRALRLRLDTVVIEPDMHQVTLKSRALVPLRRKSPPLEEIVLGNTTRAWWRARFAGKTYLSLSGQRTPPAVPANYFRP